MTTLSRHTYQSSQVVLHSHSNGFPIRFWAFLLLFSIVLTSLTGCSPMAMDQDHPPGQTPKSFSTRVEATPREFERFSQYLTMRDGVKIAVDIYLPESHSLGETFPTIL
ncbi:MAG: hypothetical protein V3T42_04660, partial [Nitrospirales bacterium]